MVSEKRHAGSDLTRLAPLQQTPKAFNLFQALRLIEAAHPGNPRLGTSRRPSEDPVRFSQTAELAFPSATVEAFEQGDGPARLTQHMFGLFGPNGPMPLHLTEYTRDRDRNHDDPTLGAFADMFHHRMLSLLYRAWAGGQPTASFDRADDDGFGEIVRALAGYAGDAMVGRDAMPDVSKQHFAGLLANAPKSEAGLKAILAQMFAAPVEIESFVGSWLHLDAEDRGALGRASLGGSANLGRKVWSRAAKFRVRIGPLSLTDFERLLPGTPGYKRLAAILRNYAGDTLDWEANLLLHADDVPRPVLSRSATLGRKSWIGRRPARPADELKLTPPRAHAL